MVYDCGTQSSGIKILLLIALRPFLTSDLGVTFRGMGLTFRGMGLWGAHFYRVLHYFSVVTARPERTIPVPYPELLP